MLVDGNALMQSSYHARSGFVNNNEEPIGGVYQFFISLRSLLTQYNFDHVYIFWDGRLSGKLRYDLYSDYKANRDKDYINGTTNNPEDFIFQKERVKEYSEEFYIRQYEDEVVEADDCIAYYCLNKQDEEKVFIVTGDKDLCQLITDGVGVYLINKKVLVTKENFQGFFGYPPENVKLIKMISGDNSDFIKGVKGIGEPTLLKYFPEIKENGVTLNEILGRAKVLQEERKKPLTTLENILNGVTLGVQGDKLYEINEKIIDLKKPLLTDECKETLDSMINAPIDPEGRDIKNAITMFYEDGLMKLLGDYETTDGSEKGYVKFLRPFLRLMNKEKKLYQLQS